MDTYLKNVHVNDHTYQAHYCIQKFWKHVCILVKIEVTQIFWSHDPSVLTMHISDMFLLAKIGWHRDVQR